MARRKTAKQIVEEAMPGMEVIEQSARPRASEDAPSVTPPPPGPSIQDLRRKYLGDSAEEDAAGSRREANPAEDEDAADDIEVVQVRPKQPATDSSTRQSIRTVVVSKSKGKIIGKQG